MILLGSKAASITNSLPSWRMNSYSNNEYDILGTEIELNNLLSYFSETSVPYFVTETSINKVFIFCPNKYKVEFDYHLSSSAILIKNLTDNVPCTVFNFEAKAISTVTQYIIKKAYERFPVNREKNDKDLVFWKQYIKENNLLITEEHKQLFDVLWDEFEEKFNADKSINISKPVDLLL